MVCHCVSQGKGKEYSQLKLHILPDNYVMLESAKFPGRFVNMSANGMPKPPQMVSLSDADGQFYVRVVVRPHRGLDVLLSTVQE